MELSNAIKCGMRSAGISTYEELSKMSGVPLSTIKKYTAKSVTHSPNISNLKKLGVVIDLGEYLSLNVSQYSENVSPSVSYSTTLSTSQENDSSMIKSDKIDSSMLSLNQKNVQQSTLDKDFVKIPIYDVYASAGQGLINDEHISRHIEIDKGFLRSYFGLTSFSNLSIIMGSGDSMLPTIPENCYLLIQQGDVKEGKICVTRIDDELYIKRLQKLPRYKLISDNKSYDDIVLDGKDYEILGVVVGLFQKL